MDNNFSIRVARKKDLPIILSFIKKLAVYEKMEDQVIATEKSLKDWLFNKKVAKVIFASFISFASNSNGMEKSRFLYFLNKISFSYAKPLSLATSSMYLSEL